MSHVPYPGCYCADCVEGAEPIGYINAEMLNRKIEFEANGMVMFDRPCGAATMPLYAEPPSARITGDKDRSVQSRAPTRSSDILALLAEGKVLARFWSKVDTQSQDECWLWTGLRNRKGYGKFHIGGSYEVATRVMLALQRGRALSSQELACHHCDTPPCVNPSHLFVGSHQDNMVDAVRKGRVNLGNLSRGEYNLAKTECLHGHPLTEDNLYVSKEGWRQCRICQRKNRAEWKRRRKDARHG